MLVYIFIISTQIGHIPQYGLDLNPSNMGFKNLHCFNFLIFILAFYSSIIWSVLTLILLFVRRELFYGNKTSIVFFISSMLFYFVFRFFFESQFLWYFD